MIGVLLLLFIAQIYWYARYLCAPARKLRKSKKHSPIRLRHPLCA